MELYSDFYAYQQHFCIFTNDFQQQFSQRFFKIRCFSFATYFRWRNGVIKWILDANVRNTKGYETCRIWEISNVIITKDTDPIKLSFTGHWTYGAEAGSMKIDRGDGDNSFCLSW